MHALYREIVIWRRTSDLETVRYTCFENLRSGRFCVQVADFIRLPLDDVQALQQTRNRIELFIEGQLAACTWHDALTSAIHAHDESFENFFTEDFPRA